MVGVNDPGAAPLVMVLVASVAARQEGARLARSARRNLYILHRVAGNAPGVKEAGVRVADACVSDRGL